MIDVKKVGMKIREIRIKKGYTQEELCELLDLGDRIKMSRIENGKQSMTANELINFCNTLNISLDYLINDSNLSAEEFLTFGSRFIENDEIDFEQKREVIQKLYVDLSVIELNSIGVYQNMNNNAPKDTKVSKNTIEKYKVNPII